jgi:hypothetical protein
MLKRKRDDIVETDDERPSTVPSRRIIKQTKAAFNKLRTHARPSRVVEEVQEDDSSDAFWQSTIESFEKVAREADCSRNIYTRNHLSQDLLRDVRDCGGDQRLDAIRKTLNNLGYTRSQFQKMFHGTHRREARGAEDLARNRSDILFCRPFSAGMLAHHLRRRLGAQQRARDGGNGPQEAQAGSSSPNATKIRQDSQRGHVCPKVSFA